MNSIFVFLLIMFSLFVGGADNREMPHGFYLIAAVVMFIGAALLYQADEESRRGK